VILESKIHSWTCYLANATLKFLNNSNAISVPTHFLMYAKQPFLSVRLIAFRLIKITGIAVL